MTADEAVPRRGYFVYRIFDAADQLIYIGSTSDVEGRIYSHKRNFGNLVSIEIRRRYARHTSEWFATGAEGKAAEREAIRTEAPLLNRHHNPSRWRWVGNEYVPVETERAAS